jgi:adenosine deaminase/adenosine deaminase CECR1
VLASSFEVEQVNVRLLKTRLNGYQETHMKSNLWLVFLCALVLNGAEAKDQAVSSRQRNLAATRNLYSELTSGSTPKIAELTLFTNMLPKGGDLHHHYSGAIYAETYLDWVEVQNYCVYRASDAALKIEKFKIETKPQKLNEAARLLCVSAERVREDNSFYRELLEKWSDKDFDNHFHEQAAPDKHFFDTFGYFGEVSDYDYSTGLQVLKERAKAENLGYLETMLKSGPAIEHPELDKRLNALNAASSSQQIDDTLSQATDLLAGDAGTIDLIDGYAKTVEAAAAGLDDEDFRLRFLVYVGRNGSPAKVFSSLYGSFAVALRSKLVVGVNIVAPENGHVSMRDYGLHMKMFAFLKKRFPGVRLSLHAGELALGMVPPEGLRSHIREAVLVAGADRIGHGVDIAHEAGALELLRKMKQREIAVEINLSSNAFILGIKNEAHPLRLYNRFGVPIVISTDDAGVSRNNLSSEYLLYVSRYTPSYDELKRVVYNSIRYSFLPEDEKRDEMMRLDKRFTEFEASMARLPRTLR